MAKKAKPKPLPTKGWVNDKSARREPSGDMTYPRVVQWEKAGTEVTLDLLSGDTKVRKLRKWKKPAGAQSDTFRVLSRWTKKPRKQRIILGGKMDALVTSDGGIRMVLRNRAPTKKELERFGKSRNLSGKRF